MSISAPIVRGKTFREKTVCKKRLQRGKSPATRSARAAAAPTIAVAAALAAASPAAAAAERLALSERIVHEGIAIEVEVEGVGAVAGGSGLRQGDDVTVRFKISDTLTGTPLGSLYPAAWMDFVPGDQPEGPEACANKISSFLGGTLLALPELDLNVYYVLALNDDATISVVDPLFGFGGSKLLDMVFLDSPGEDWALAEAQNRLFVSLPESNRVAVVRLADWRLEDDIDVGPRPRRLLLQDDGRHLWVSHEAPRPGEEISGVTVIDTRSLEPVAHIATGLGSHALALSDDDRFAFVTNRQSGTVSVIDARALRKLSDVASGSLPVSVAYSNAARAAYVSHEGDGTVAVIDGGRQRLVARLQAEPGLGEISFTPDHRLALVVNPRADVVHVVDAATNRIVQTADMAAGPDQVAFSDELAYVRHRGSEAVYMIPLAELGRKGAPVPVVEFPGGQHPPGNAARPSPAAGIVQAPGATAVLVANPADRVIYYYKEGMAAPMGHFENYGRQPRAVQVVDRSLREKALGVYETTVKLRRPGRYDLAFFLDAPRIVHCLPLEIAPDPVRAARERPPRPVEIEPLPHQRTVVAGEEVALRFRLTRPASGAPLDELEDLRALTFLVPGTWQKRIPGAAVGDGVYEVRFTPPRRGIYHVFLEAYSLGLEVRDSVQVTLQARDPQVPTAQMEGGS